MRCAYPSDADFQHSFIDMFSREEIEWLEKIRYFRNEMCKSTHQLRTCDYGALSKDASVPFVNGGVRIYDTTLGEICRQSSVRTNKGAILFYAVRLLRPNAILELGACVGISAAYLAAAAALNRCGTLTSIEGCPRLAQVARSTLLDLGLTRGKVVEGTFFEVLPLLLPTLHGLDFVHIDGHHDGDALKAYWNMVVKHCANPAAVFLDDIHWSNDMTTAWRLIRRQNLIQWSMELSGIGVLIIRRPRRWLARLRASAGPFF